MNTGIADNVIVLVLVFQILKTNLYIHEYTNPLLLYDEILYCKQQVLLICYHSRIYEIVYCKMLYYT